jgi:dTDP-4-dehydrorhamnose 3,5-epimerase
MFGRTWCVDEARERGLHTQFEQCSVSFNRVKGTLRGLHFQIAPYAEIKLVRCTAGAIMDVVVDLRPESPTFRSWVAVELTAENRRAMYIPEGCAHGFQTLANGSEVFYQITPTHHPEFSSGVRWDDPAFGICWPEPPRALSDRDRAWPDFGT